MKHCLFWTNGKLGSCFMNVGDKIRVFIIKHDTEWETGNSGQRWERVSRCLEKLEPVKVTTHNTSPTLTVAIPRTLSHWSHCLVSRELNVTVGTWRFFPELATPRPGQSDLITAATLSRLQTAPSLAGAAPSTGRTGSDSTWPGVPSAGSQGWWHGPRHNRLGWSEQLCRGNTDPAQIHEQSHFCSVCLAACCVLNICCN